ncbi:MAG: energy-coupling factor transporter transmembrane component T [Candidatus Aenigmatarchaeota archaeon]
MRFVSYIKKNSLFHKLDPRAKLFLCLVLILLSFLFNHPLFLFSLFLVVVCLSSLAKIQKEFLFRIKLLTPLVIMAFFLWAFFYRWSLFKHSTGEVIFEIGPLQLDYTGLMYGLAMPFRIMVMIGVPLLFLMTTTLNELVLSLVKLRFPYKFAFTFGLSARLIPTLGNEFLTLKEAQASRGLELDKGNLFKRIKSYIPVLIPLTLKALEFSDQMSMAMETKAFGASKERVFYREIKMKKVDYLIIAISLLSLFAGVLMRFMRIGVIE